MKCQLAFVLLTLSLVTENEANTLSRKTTPAPKNKSNSNSCKSYTQAGKGNYKLQRRHYTSQVFNYYVKQIELVERTSFYKCEPRNEKYGIEEQTNTWWVDKGCEGLFRVLVCPDNVDKPHPHPENWRGTVYSELLLNLKAPEQRIDWTHFNMKGVENRFEYHIQAMTKNKPL